MKKVICLLLFIQLIIFGGGLYRKLVFADTSECVIHVNTFHVGEGAISGNTNGSIRKCELTLNEKKISETMVDDSGNFTLNAISLYGEITAQSILKIIGYDNHIKKVEKVVPFIIDEERSEIIQPTDQNYTKSICAIRTLDKNGQVVRATGFVISKNLILTNKHVISDVNSLVSARVYPGATQSSFGDVQKSFSVEAAIAHAANDISIIKVGKNFKGQSIGEYTEPLKLVKNFSNTINTKLSIIGYPGDKPWPTMWSSKGKVIANSETISKLDKYSIITDAYTVPGNSGSPIFNEENEVIGILKGSIEILVGNKAVNTGGIRFTPDLYDWIQSEISKIDCLTSPVVTIPDNNLKKFLKEKLKLINDNEITEAKLASLSGDLNLSDKGIENLEGIQYTNIKSINLSYNSSISNLAPLTNFKSLTSLDLSYCNITTVGTLGTLGKIGVLSLKGNHIKDLSPLSRLVREIDATDQEILEELVSVDLDSPLTVSLENLKDQFGMLPGFFGDHFEIYPQNGGIFTAGKKVIEWSQEKLKNLESVSYYFGDKEAIDEEHSKSFFSGKVIIPFAITAKPNEWALSVPVSLNLTEKYTAPNGLNYKRATGSVAITLANGTAFEDSSKDRTFKVDGMSKYTGAENQMALKTENEDKEVTLMGSLSEQGGNSMGVISAKVNSIQNIAFKSLTTGNTGKPLTRQVQLLVWDDGKTQGTYTGAISWTASEQ